MAYDVPAERSAGWSAIAFVIVTIVGVVAASTPPPLSTSGAGIAAYVAVHQNGLVFASWIQFLVVIFFLWFIVGLRGYLREAAGSSNDGLPTYMLIGGLGLSILLLVDAAFSLAIAYPPAGTLAPYTMRTLYLLSQLFGVYTFVPGAVFAFGAANSMRRHNSAPPHVVWIGYLAALLLAIGTLSVFVQSGAFAVGGRYDLVAILVLLLWVLLSGIFLVGRKTPPAQA